MGCGRRLVDTWSQMPAPHSWLALISFICRASERRKLSLGTLLIIPVLLLLMLALPKVTRDTCLWWKEAEGRPVPCSSYAVKDTQSPEGTQRGAAAGLEAWALL